MRKKNIVKFIAIVLVMMWLPVCVSAGEEDFNQMILADAAPQKIEPALDEALGDDLDDFEDEFGSTPAQSVSDPLYYFNYCMYVFNDKLYFGLLKPVAAGYKTVVPTGVRKCVYNFFYNLVFPVRFVNNLLQGKMNQAGTEFQAFLINSTIGLVGFHNVAHSYYQIDPYEEDLGQTLGSYDIGNGFYLVLPVLGPSTLRDTIGKVGDFFLTPLNYVEPVELSYGLKVYDTVNTTSFRIGDYETLKDAAFDPYTAIKDAYIQNRKEKIRK